MHGSVDKAASGPYRRTEEVAGESSRGWIKTVLLAASAVWSIGLGSPAFAIPFSTALDFVAPTQSMWGPRGSTASFGAKDDWEVGPFSLSYDVGASSGTVSALYKGDLLVDHPSRHGRPGVAPLSLRFQGDANGGSIKSDLGAWAKVAVVGINVLDKDYGLNIQKTFTPALHESVTESDDFVAGSVGIDVLVATAGASLNVEQTDIFVAEAIKGTLAYSRRGSGKSTLTPFSITGNNVLNVDVDLNDWGFWDFSVIDMELDSSFAASFDLGLVIYEEHVSGIRTCNRCVRVPFLGKVCVPIPCGLDYDRNEAELASIDVYNADPFALTFNKITAAEKFSIYVPEPNGLALMAIGLLGLVGARTRRVIRLGKR